MRRIEGVSGSGQVMGPEKPQQVFSKVPDDYIMIKKKSFLAFFFFSEAVWRIKELAKNKSDVVREVIAVADKFLRSRTFTQRCCISSCMKDYQGVSRFLSGRGEAR